MLLTEHYVALAADQKRAPSVRPIVDAMTEIMARLLLIQSAYTAFRSGKAVAIQFPYSEVETTVVKIEALIAQSTANLDVPWDLNIALRNELRALRRLRLVKDIFSSLAKSSEAVANVFVVQSRSRKGYMVQWGDTLRGVAQRFLNDGDRWLEIATLNSLDYPYVVNREADIPSGKAVAIPGDLITLPLDAQDPKNQVVGSMPTDYGTLLGQDVLLDASGFLEFDAGGDFITVSGGENLAQAVRHRLIIPKGQLPLHPDYGSELELYIGAQGTPAAVEQAGLEVRRTIRQDPRITRIDNATAQFNSTALTASLTARVIGQESPAELNLVIPRL
jgi:phage baseplate assembly protein W